MKHKKSWSPKERNAKRTWRILAHANCNSTVIKRNKTNKTISPYISPISHHSHTRYPRRTWNLIVQASMAMFYISDRLYDIWLFNLSRSPLRPLDGTTPRMAEWENHSRWSTNGGCSGKASGTCKPSPNLKQTYGCYWLFSKHFQYIGNWDP